MLNTIVFWTQNKDYYLYLLKTSWPALIGLFVVCLFIVFRFFQSIQDARADDSRKKRSWILGLRVIISLIVIAVYHDMFVKSYPDWSEQPGLTQGVVHALHTYNDPGDNYSPNNYVIEIKDDNLIKPFTVDRDTFNKLDLNDRVKIEYLPVKKEVFRCTILTRQASTVIY